MLRIRRLHKPSILRERIGSIDHPKLGTVQISQTLNRAALLFEIGDVYHVVDVEAVAAEVFDQIDANAAEGKAGA